jgi:hypothetical protein
MVLELSNIFQNSIGAASEISAGLGLQPLSNHPFKHPRQIPVPTRIHKQYVTIFHIRL